jgi:hypothetical protein
MSRYTKRAADKLLVYGHDHALGFFYEEWLQPEGDDDRPISDRCQKFGMPIREMVDKLIQYRTPLWHREALIGERPF